MRYYDKAAQIARSLTNDYLFAPVRFFGGIVKAARYFQMQGFASKAPAGSVGLMFHTGNKPDDIAIIGLHDPEKGPPVTLQDYEAVVFNANSGAYIYIQASGNILVKPGNGGRVQVDGDLEVDGRALIKGEAVVEQHLTVTGNAGVQGDLTSNGISLRDHTHLQNSSAPRRRGGGVQTDPPTR